MATDLPLAALATMNQKMDAIKIQVAQRFMELATTLQASARNARRICDASLQVTGAQTSQHSGQCIAMLQSVLADTMSFTEMVATGSQNMSFILAQVNGIASPLRRLTHMSTMLKTVSMLCGIEGKKINSNVGALSNLSGDIERLAIGVGQHIDGIIDDIFFLSGLLKQGVGELNQFGEQERGKVDCLIERAQVLLGPALHRAEASMGAARAIDEQYVGFRHATDSVVVSLQSEDMARQRIEHVQEALQHVASQIDCGADLASCANVLVLQRAQLAGTRDMVARSIQEIHSGLQLLSPQIEDLVSRTINLAHQTKRDGQSFCALIDSGRETVADVFRNCSASAGTVVSTIHRVLPAVEKMTSRIAALEEIKDTLRLISLNASAKTSQLGFGGAVIGVLASELHTISREQDSDTTIVLSALTSIREALNGITQGRAMTQGSANILQGDGDLVGRELGGFSQSIHTSSLQISLQLEELTHIAGDLYLQLREAGQMAVSSVSFTALFDDLLHSFDLALLPFGISMDAIVAGPDDHRHLTDRYSMESERIMHQQVLEGSSSIDSVPNLPDLRENPSEFGSNIELF